MSGHRVFQGISVIMVLSTGSLSALADNHGTMIDEGERRFERACADCHFINDSGRHKAGPNLYGIIGAKAGTRTGFEYSRSFFSQADFIWTEEKLDSWIANPEDVVHGNNMPFMGMRSDEDRAALLAYIKDAGS